MCNPSTPARRGPALTLAALASLLVSAAGFAATSGATPQADISAQSSSEMPESDEIWVRGKQLFDVIADNEGHFYRRYNELNTNNEFDLQCRSARLSSESLAMSHTCLPHYFTRTNNSAGSFNVSSGVRLGASTSPSSSGWVVGNSMDLRTNWSVNQSAMQTSAYSARSRGLQPESMMREFVRRLVSDVPCDSEGALAGCSLEMHAGSRASEVANDLRLGPGLRELLRNFAQVLHSDPQLMKQAVELTALYEEMDSIQDSYMQVMTRHEAQQGQSATGAPVPVGPRGARWH